jgi:ParB/RepB/Spo0J family partition protein
MSASAKYQEVAISRLRPNPFNPRKTADRPEDQPDQLKIKDMAESIRKDGVLSPIMVRPKDGNYEVAFGGRRLLGLKMGKASKVAVIVRPLDDREMRRYSMVENLHRLEMTAEEKEEALGKIFEQDYKHSKVGAGAGNKGGVRQMARDFGIPQKTLGEYIQAHETRAAEKMSAIAHLSPKDTVKVGRILKDSPKAARVLAKARSSGGLTAARLEDAVTLVQRAPAEHKEQVAEGIARAAEKRVDDERASDKVIEGEMEDAKAFVDKGKVSKQISWEIRGDQARLNRATALAEMARKLDATYLETFYDPKARAQAVDILYEAGQALLATARAGRDPANVKRWGEDHNERKALASGAGSGA